MEVRKKVISWESLLMDENMQHPMSFARHRTLHHAGSDCLTTMQIIKLGTK